MKQDNKETKMQMATVGCTDGGGAVQSMPVQEGKEPLRYWFVGVVENRHEKKVAERVQATFPGVEAYVPVCNELRRWSGGRRRKVEMVVIPAKVFVRATETERLKVLKSNLGITYFFVDAARATDRYGRRPIARVPDAQMRQLRQMLGNAESPVDFTECRFVKGERVRVVSGPLAGIEGIVKQDAQGSKRLYVVIESLGCASTEVESQMVEKM